MSNEITIWSENKLTDIKKLFADNLNQNEFETFVGIWKVTWLNPFLREIWAVKYGNAPANIFIWRDWYRKSAQANKEYDYHLVDAVYENDEFSVKNWEVEHIYNFKNRWALIWAYCLVKRKSSTKAMFTFVELIEYYQWNKIIKNWIITEEIKIWVKWPMKETIWDSKPATMIKKVAEAQGLRWSFQELFAWTYEESEEIFENTEVKLNISEEEQNKNFDKYYNKMFWVSSIEELWKVFVELNKERKNNKNFLRKEQIEELVKIKDEIKEKLTIKEAEIIEENEEIANTRTWD